MIEWLSGTWSALSWTRLLLGAVIFVLTSLVSMAAMMFFLVRLPTGYFSDRATPHPAHARPPGVRGWAGRAARTLLGAALFALGVVMALPGVPGPGLLVMLGGIMLAEFPGKYRLERWLVTRPGVLDKINQVRTRYGKPPMLLENEPGKG
jgi:hypothetical protein